MSLDTAEEGSGGPGNGAGLALVRFGFVGDLAYGGAVGHLWREDDVSLTTIQATRGCFEQKGERNDQ